MFTFCNNINFEIFSPSNRIKLTPVWVSPRTYFKLLDDCAYFSIGFISNKTVKVPHTVPCSFNHCPNKKAH